MRLLLVIVFFLFGFFGVGQEQQIKDVDSLYKEDQLYVGITYNFLGNKPKRLSQNGFSLGFHLGFIKDMPINKRRNLAIGLGLGYSTNSFNQNVLIDKSDNNRFVYSILDDPNAYTKNKFSMHLVEVPLEFRWRTSTSISYNFWRIYTGFKASYMLAHTSKYRGDLGSIKYTDIGDFNKFQYGVTLSVGYNTWNIHLYYALNSIFSDNVNLVEDSLNINAIKIGLIFYLL